MEVRQEHWTDLSKEDKPWAEFSTLAGCVDICQAQVEAYQQNGPT